MRTLKLATVRRPPTSGTAGRSLTGVNAYSYASVTGRIRHAFGLLPPANDQWRTPVRFVIVSPPRNAFEDAEAGDRVVVGGVGAVDRAVLAVVGVVEDDAPPGEIDLVGDEPGRGRLVVRR